jgi:ABC-type transport system involved in multi-copper enzyme maturation permease subunit
MPVVLRWFLRLGPLNPIAVRLVQGGSRRRRHLYIRAIYLGVLILTLLYLLLTNVGQGNLNTRALASAAARSFEWASYLQIGLICLLAPVFMAGAIAQEANPRTWDILLTTPMSAGEIVLGNLFGRLFFILALLFSSLPLFALTQLFGGVPNTTIFESYLIAACAALFVGALAIALSVSRLVGKRAVFTFYVGVVSFLAVTYAIDKIAGTSGFVSYMTAINPFLALKSLVDPTHYNHYPQGSQIGVAVWFLEQPIATFCVLSAGLSVVLMALSTFTVRLGGIAGLGGQGGRGGVPWYRRMFGLGAKGAEYRAPRKVWNNPIAWREAAARNATLGRMAARWMFIVIGAIWGIGITAYFHLRPSTMFAPEYRDIVLYTVVGELVVVALVALNMSATAVAREREDGTLDLLLTTPITPAAYLGGKVRGMIAYLLPLLAIPIGTLLIAGFYVALVDAGLFHHPAPTGAGGGDSGVMLVHQLRTQYGQSGASTLQIPAILPEAGIILGVITLPFIAFCCMVGLMWSLKSKGSIGSVVATVGIVGVVAGSVGLCAFKSGSGIEIVGPVLAASGPLTAAYSGVYPEDALDSTLNAQGLATARIGLFIGALIFGGIWIAVVYGLRASLVHNFDMTVRRLAGTA